MRANEVPAFDSEDTIRRTVICERCLQPTLYRLDVASGHFVYECPCTHLEATEIHTLRGPGELRLSRPVHRVRVPYALFYNSFSSFMLGKIAKRR
jgi:hypothetical protein